MPLLTIYCFHHAGGAASYFYPWKRQVLPNIELVPIQLPGRENRMDEQFIQDIQDLSTQIAESITFSKPYIFFGHSLGGLVAFETIHQLQMLSKPLPEILAISAHRAPQLPIRTMEWIHLPDHLFVQSISEIYEGLQNEILISEEMLQFLLPRLRADFALCQNYSYQKRKALEIPIIVFGAKDDKSVGLSELMGWAEQTASHFQYYQFMSGGHFYLNNASKAILNHIYHAYLTCASA